MYSQIDPRWSGMSVPNTGGVMATEGCYIVCIANALLNAGYPDTPADVLNKLSNNNGFTNDGLVIHAAVSMLYPITYGIGTEAFIGGEWKTTHGTFQHWLLQLPSGEYVNSYNGTMGMPSGYTETTSQLITVAPMVVPTPEPVVETPPAPVDTPPTPEPVVSAPEVATPEPFLYTVQPGDNLTNICSSHYGLPRENGDAYRKALEVASYNNIQNPDLIEVGQIIKLP